MDEHIEKYQPHFSGNMGGGGVYTVYNEIFIIIIYTVRACRG